MKQNRIYILGTIGSGKSFLANRLSKILNIPCYDLDDIFWLNKFNKKRNKMERNQLFQKLCNKKEWIIEGVYSTWVEEGIKKSDLVIFLDINTLTLLYRTIKRYIKREKSKKKGKDRYQENLKDLLGLIKAIIKYKRKNYDRGYYKHKELIGKHKVDVAYLKNKKELNRFLKDYVSA
jgi:adenylate kinase family enzyme